MITFFGWTDQIKSPWNENPFKVNESSPGLTKDMVEHFPKGMGKGFKRGRPVICLVNW
jgi:hypothetical protein